MAASGRGDERGDRLLPAGGTPFPSDAARNACHFERGGGGGRHAREPCCFATAACRERCFYQLARNTRAYEKRSGALAHSRIARRQTLRFGLGLADAR